MFQPLPDEDTKVQITLSSKNRKKAKAKSAISELKIRDPRFVTAMSSWAENFTLAATWQLKHQLAYWKARAQGLEYENVTLHEVISRNHLDVPSAGRKKKRADSELDQESNEDNSEQDENQSEDETEEEDEDVEVSEEFIEFLTANAKFKEEARREKERLEVQRRREEKHEDLQDVESFEDKVQKMKELYGDKWQRISAIEMSLMSGFITELDTYKPMYWPNIPLNLSSS